MNAAALEAFLARLYTDAATRARFAADPAGEGGRAGLSAEECAALKDCDLTGLQMAAESFSRKRAQHHRQRPSLLRRLLNRLLHR